MISGRSFFAPGSIGSSMLGRNLPRQSKGATHGRLDEQLAIQTRYLARAQIPLALLTSR